MVKLCSFGFLFRHCQKQRALVFGKKTYAFLFCLFQSFILFSKMQGGPKFFFLFVKTTILLCKTIKHFFVSQLSKKSKHWFKKKRNSFLLLEKLRSYVFAKKRVNIRDLLRKVMDNFTFLWHLPSNDSNHKFQ
jgi:hypothetical protein